MGFGPTEGFAPSPAVGVPGITRKQADETVNNTVVLQDDDDIKLEVGADETWLFVLFALYKAHADADLTLGWAVPSGASMIWMGIQQGGDALDESETTNMNGAGTGANPCTGQAWGVIRNGATAGDLQLRWAQSTAHASDTSVLKDTVLMAWKIA